MAGVVNSRGSAGHVLTTYGASGSDMEFVEFTEIAPKYMDFVANMAGRAKADQDGIIPFAWSRAQRRGAARRRRHRRHISSRFASMMPCSTRPLSPWRPSTIKYRLPDHVE